jgi:hypothetical protein
MRTCHCCSCQRPFPCAARSRRGRDRAPGTGLAAPERGLAASPWAVCQARCTTSRSPASGACGFRPSSSGSWSRWRCPAAEASASRLRSRVRALCKLQSFMMVHYASITLAPYLKKEGTRGSRLPKESGGLLRGVVVRGAGFVYSPLRGCRTAGRGRNQKATTSSVEAHGVCQSRPGCSRRASRQSELLLVSVQMQEPQQTREALASSQSPFAH